MINPKYLKYMFISRSEVAKLQHLETFRIKVQIVGFSLEQAQELIDEATRASQEQLAPNWIFMTEMLERMEIMLTRGDEFGQVLEWAKACPIELETALLVERLVPRTYPGGPGSLLNQAKEEGYG